VEPGLEQVAIVPGQRRAQLNEDRERAVAEADEVRRSKERNKILESVRDLGEAGPKEIAVATSMREGNVRYLVHEMAKAGELEKIGRGLYRLPK